MAFKEAVCPKCDVKQPLDLKTGKFLPHHRDASKDGGRTQYSCKGSGKKP